MGETTTATTVRIGLSEAVALGAFVSTDDLRPHCCVAYVTPRRLVASDGVSLVQIEVDADAQDSPTWTLSPAVLARVTSDREWLEVDMSTGDVVLAGMSEAHPMRLPPAGEPHGSARGIVGGFERNDTEASAVTLRVNAELVVRAVRAAAFGSRTNILLHIPPNGDDGHVDKAVRFEAVEGRVKGLIMPLRRLE